MVEESDDDTDRLQTPGGRAALQEYFEGCRVWATTLPEDDLTNEEMDSLWQPGG